MSSFIMSETITFEKLNAGLILVFWIAVVIGEFHILTVLL